MLSLSNGMAKAILVRTSLFKFVSPIHQCRRVSTSFIFTDLLELKNVTARRRSWRAKEYNSLTQGRPMSPETQRYYDEQFSQGTMDYPAGQLYQNDGSWQQDAFNGYTINGLEPSQGLGHL
jgi:hypothetical protein